ncbi:MAG: Holliday junction resolvase RuvX [Puniceicoccales bacterium]|jgi:putative Holliday junction resolvase|nr:Holliday junction resolvase RuvX [Puniceicoccales bacterium]
MRYLGIDYGTRRLGLSYGDEMGVAVPVDPIIYAHEEVLWNSLDAAIRSRKIDAFVLGYPTHMCGKSTKITALVEQFEKKLCVRYGKPIHRSDERLTSFQVFADHSTYGTGPAYRNMGRHRRTGKDDSRAAAVILQDFLDGINSMNH